MGDQDIIALQNGCCSAQVHLFGATLLSWVVDGIEHLFVSKESHFDCKKAIRGGVPFVFPQFGPWADGPQHGFARTSKWSVADEKQIGTDSVTFILEDDDKTRAIWNKRFRIEYTITLGDKQIKMNVKVTNTGKESFPFTLLLHTYFSVPDVLLCNITGFKGCTYTDKVKNGLTFKEERDEIKVEEFTDSVYQKTSQEHIITAVAGGRRIMLKKSNFPDTVVWNPWSENAKKMSDFGDEEWKNMICVEAGHVNQPVVIGELQDFSASQTLIVID